MRRYLTSIGLLLCTAGTAACTSVEALRPDMEARPVPSRLDEIAYINGMRQAYEDASATTGSCYLGTDLKPFRPKFVQGYRETDPKAEQATEGACIRFTPADPKSVSKSAVAKSATTTAVQVAVQTKSVPAVDALNPVNPQAAQIQDYLDNGFGLTDLYCSRFIMVAAETRQSRRMQRNTSSAVGTLVGIVLDAVSAGASTVTASTGAFAAVDSTYKNIDDAFVIAPDKDSLIRLVQNAQDAYRKQAIDKPPRSFAEARSKIERYASFCTYDGMQALVNSSVQLASQSLKKEGKDGQDEKPPTGTQESVDKPKPPQKPEKATPATDALLPG